jgi:hypothetical protein
MAGIKLAASAYGAAAQYGSCCWPLGRDHAGVHAHPAQAAKQARVFDFHAAVLDDLQAGVLGALGGVLIHHAELQPQAARADGDGILGQRWDVFALAKAVHHVDAPALLRDGLRRLGHAGEAASRPGCCRRLGATSGFTGTMR